MDKNKIIEFVDKPPKPNSSVAAVAIYILPPRLLPHLSQYCSKGRGDNLGGLIASLIIREEVRAYTFADLWLDIGATEGLP